MAYSKLARSGTTLALVLGATTVAVGPAAAGLPGPSCNLTQSFGMNNWAPVSLQAVAAEVCSNPYSYTGISLKIYRLTLRGSVLVASGSGQINYVCNGTGQSESYQEVENGYTGGPSESFYCD